MKKILIALSPVFAVAGVYLILPVLSLLPGFAGELFRMIFGVITTPFILEITLAFFGLVALLTCNNIRRNKDGDDYVVISVPDETSRNDAPQS